MNRPEIRDDRHVRLNPDRCPACGGTHEPPTDPSGTVEGMFWPAVFVVLTVLCFNFVGDGLRDAADPYS